MLSGARSGTDPERIRSSRFSSRIIRYSGFVHGLYGEYFLTPRNSFWGGRIPRTAVCFQGPVSFHSLLVSSERSSVPCRGRCGHFRAPLYFSVAVLHTKNLGGHENDLIAHC
jgi:hypothetical protein